MGDPLERRFDGDWQRRVGCARSLAESHGNRRERRFISSCRTDRAAFIALHGTFGEDGGSAADPGRSRRALHGEGARESELAFNKIRSKEAFHKHDVPTPDWQIITLGQRPTIPDSVCDQGAVPGSTVGVHITRNEREVDAAIADASTTTASFVEKFIPGVN